jgi:hypothetical protein
VAVLVIRCQGGSEELAADLNRFVCEQDRTVSGPRTQIARDGDYALAIALAHPDASCGDEVPVADPSSKRVLAASDQGTSNGG